MRRIAFAGFLLSGLAVAAPSGAAAQDAEPPVVTPPGRPAADASEKVPAIAWIDGWEAGRAAARGAGRLAFVFVRGTEPPWDEGSRILETGVLAEPDALKIGERAVPVRVDVTRAPSQAVRDFLTRYGITACPAFLVLDAEGHVACNSMKHTAAGLLAAVGRAETAQRDFEETRRKGDAENRRWFRELLAVRLAWDDLIPYQEADLAAAPAPAAYAEMARLYQRACRRDAEKRTLASAALLFPKDPLRTRWRMRLATMGCDLLATDAEQLQATVDALVPLAAALAAEKDATGEAEARVVVAHSLAKQRKFDEACAAYDRVVELAPDARTAPIALLGRASVAWAEYDYAGCKALCERICREYAKTDEAKAAAGTIKSCDAKMK